MIEETSIEFVVTRGIFWHERIKAFQTLAGAKSFVRGFKKEMLKRKPPRYTEKNLVGALYPGTSLKLRKSIVSQLKIVKITRNEIQETVWGTP